jgi:predicted MFS family arabinose efflux permease
VLGLYAIPAALAAAAAAAWLRERPGAPPALPSPAAAFRRYAEILRLPRARRVYLAIACEGVLMYGLFPYVVPYIMAEGVTAGRAGLAFLAWGVGGLAYTLLVRPILRLLGVRRMMPVAGCLAGAALLAVPLVQVWWAIVALFLVNGFGLFMLHNTLQTQGSEISPKARASAMSLFAFSLFFGQGAGPIAFAMAAAVLGSGPSFALFGVLLALLGVTAGRFIRPAGMA